MTARVDPALNALRGNPGRREPFTPAVSVPVLTRIPQPYGELSPGARVVFDDMADALIRAGLLTALDVPLLSAFAASFDTYLTASREYAATPTVAGQKGNPVKHPSGQIARDALTLAHALAKDLGLSPNARKSLVGQALAPTGLSDLEAALAGVSMLPLERR